MGVANWLRLLLASLIYGIPGVKYIKLPLARIASRNKEF